jgi:hypothetical protein
LFLSVFYPGAVVPLRDGPNAWPNNFATIVSDTPAISISQAKVCLYLWAWAPWTPAISNNLFDDAASQWLVKHRATEDAATLSQILTRTRANLERLGGYPAPSSFERSYLELVSEGVIKSFRADLFSSSRLRRQQSHRA